MPTSVSLSPVLYSAFNVYLFFSRSVLASFSLAPIFVYIYGRIPSFFTICSSSLLRRSVPLRSFYLLAATRPIALPPCPSSRRSFPEIYVRYSGCYKLCHCNRRKTSRKHVVCARMRNIGRRAVTSLSLSLYKNKKKLNVYTVYTLRVPLRLLNQYRCISGSRSANKFYARSQP